MALVEISGDATLHEHPGPTAAVEVADLRTVVGRRTVLDGVSLRVGRGEVVAVLGRPGAGRSVLLRALAGLDYRARGGMLVLPRAGYLPQDARLQRWRRAAANVAAGTAGAAPDDLALALHRVGMDGDERRRARSLSSGERRRVALARAIVGRPSVLLLDEPSAGLDPVTAAQLRAALQRVIAEDRPAVVLSTADVDEALLFADRVVVLARGQLGTDLHVDVDRPRRRSDPRFAALRSELCAALGIDETAEGSRP